jgi:hypothetical protein
MANWYIDHIDLSATCAQISYADYGIYMSGVYAGYNDTSIVLGNAATSIADFDFLSKFPINSLHDTDFSVHNGDEFWYKDSTSLIVAIDIEWRDFDTAVHCADYTSADLYIDVQAISVEDYDFRLKADYPTAETNFYLPLQDEWYSTDATTYIEVGEQFGHAQGDYEVYAYFEDTVDSYYRLVLTGNVRYITRIRFKEKNRYASIIYRLEYLAAQSQVWTTFVVEDAKVNGEDTPVWSPIRQNPCTANIYRSEEWIDIYVQPVFATEVRMMIYATEDPFNRTGIIEFGVYADIERTYVDAAKVGWRGEYFDSTNVSQIYHGEIVGFSAYYTPQDATSIIYIDDIKTNFAANHGDKDTTTVNDFKVYFDPLYVFEDYNIGIHVDKPYKETNLYIDLVAQDSTDASTYIATLGAAAVDATCFIPFPEYYDSTMYLDMLGHQTVDATTYVYVDKPYIDSTAFIPTPGHYDATCVIACRNEALEDATTYVDVVAPAYVDSTMYFDTLPQALEDGAIGVYVDEPYVDSTTFLRIPDFIDATTMVPVAIRVYSDLHGGSFIVGLPVSDYVAGSYNVKSATVTEMARGSFNVSGSNMKHYITFRVMSDAEAQRQDDLGIVLDQVKDEYSAQEHDC